MLLSGCSAGFTACYKMYFRDCFPTPNLLRRSRPSLTSQQNHTFSVVIVISSHPIVSSYPRMSLWNHFLRLENQPHVRVPQHFFSTLQDSPITSLNNLALSSS